MVDFQQARIGMPIPHVSQGRCAAVKAFKNRASASEVSWVVRDWSHWSRSGGRYKTRRPSLQYSGPLPFKRSLARVLSESPTYCAASLALRTFEMPMGYPSNRRKVRTPWKYTRKVSQYAVRLERDRIPKNLVSEQFAHTPDFFVRAVLRPILMSSRDVERIFFSITCAYSKSELCR